MNEIPSCYACETTSFDAYYNWKGLPFSGQRTSKVICMVCGSTIKVDHNGEEITYDLHTLSEMIEEGFNKEDSADSIKIVGRILKLTPKQIKEKLKK